MATLNVTCTTTASGLTSDVISSVVATSANITTGGIQRVSITAEEATKAVLLDASTFPAYANTKSTYVYIKNAGPLEIRLSFLGVTANDQNAEISLGAGEWTFFPWRCDTAKDITVYQFGGSGTGIVEYGVFN